MLRNTLLEKKLNTKPKLNEHILFNHVLQQIKLSKNQLFFKQNKTKTGKNLNR